MFTGLSFRAIAQGQAVAMADGIDGRSGGVGEEAREQGPGFKIHQTRVICLPR